MSDSEKSINVYYGTEIVSNKYEFVSKPKLVAASSLHRLINFRHALNDSPNCTPDLLSIFEVSHELYTNAMNPTAVSRRPT